MPKNPTLGLKGLFAFILTTNMKKLIENPFVKKHFCGKKSHSTKKNLKSFHYSNTLKGRTLPNNLLFVETSLNFGIRLKNGHFDQIEKKTRLKITSHNFSFIP